MRLLLTCLCAIGTAFNSQAQPQMANSGFEAWEGSGAGVEPVEWSSIKTSTGGVAFALPQVCFQSGDAHSGTGSLRIRSGILPAQTVTGIVTNGRVHASQTEGGYLYTDVDNAQWQTVLTDRPDSLVIWYKASPQGSDFPGIQAYLHFGDGRIPAGSTLANWVAEAVWTGNPGAVIPDWTRLSVPFNYLSEESPEFILVGLTSSQVGNALANSEVIFDDLSLVYNITPVLQDAMATVTPSEGYELTVDFSTTGTPLNTTAFIAELSDANGSFDNPLIIGSVSTAASSGSIMAIVPANTPSGDGYRIQVSNPDPNYRSLSVPLTVTLSTEVAVTSETLKEFKVSTDRGLLMITLYGPELRLVVMEVFNSKGQLMMSESLSSGNSFRLPFNVPSGVYLVRLSDGRNVFSERIIAH